MDAAVTLNEATQFDILSDLMTARRSVRRFKPDRVSRSLVEQILAAACWAPSAYNRQPWHFVVTRGTILARAAGLLGKKARAWSDRLNVILPPEKAAGLLDFFSLLGGAPVCVFTYAEPESGAGLLQFGTPNRDSACAAMQNLLLAAHAAGLGACWVQAFMAVEAELSGLLGTEGMQLIGGVPMGYAREAPRPPGRQGQKIVWAGDE